MTYASLAKLSIVKEKFSLELKIDQISINKIPQMSKLRLKQYKESMQSQFCQPQIMCNPIISVRQYYHQQLNASGKY